jgi:outer membrane protein assembly factor BamB
LYGEGPGRIWCIDPSKQGDVSPELVVDPDGNLAPHQRIQATARIGEIQPTAIPNPNSAALWNYQRVDRNDNGKFEFDETMHWSLGSPAIKNGLLFIADFSGLIHCLNAKTGKSYWTCDTLAACWSTPLIAGERVYVADDDGDVAMLSLSPYPIKSVVKAVPGRGIIHEPRHEISMQTAIYTTPVVANNVLYIATQNELFAIAAGANSKKRQE